MLCFMQNVLFICYIEITLTINKQIKKRNIEKHIWIDIDGKRVAYIDYTLEMCSVLSSPFTGSMFLALQVLHKAVKFSLKPSHKQMSGLFFPTMNVPLFI